VVPKLNILMLAICGKVLVMVTIGISGKGETEDIINMLTKKFTKAG
jgi:hypothetical protein